MRIHHTGDQKNRRDAWSGEAKEKEEEVKLGKLQKTTAATPTITAHQRHHVAISARSYDHEQYSPAVVPHSLAGYTAPPQDP